VIAAPDPAALALPLRELHAAFLSILPRIERHGQVYFRGVRCPSRREDAVAEMVALAWVWFLRLIAQGKDPLSFPMMLATYAAKAVKCGRGVCGQEKGKNVLSQIAHQRHSFIVEPLPHSIASTHEERYSHVRGQRQQDALEERLRDNTQTPVPEQVAFRLDFPAWLETLTARERRLVREMANHERTMDLSKRFQLSPARISQLLRELHNDWTRFCGDAEPARRTGIA
jgi:hypothetical protein